MCVGLLLEAACDIEATAAADGSTALHCAANYGQVTTPELTRAAEWNRKEQPCIVQPLGATGDLHGCC